MAKEKAALAEKPATPVAGQQIPQANGTPATSTAHLPAGTIPQPAKEKAPPKDKAADFKRLVAKRTKNAVKAISLLCNLSGKSNYSYTDGQVTQMLTLLQDAVNGVKAAFAGKKDMKADVNWDV